jgi:hypothetical protein
MRALAIVAALGGIVGALVLLLTPPDSFRVLVPYLVLLSSGLLAVQPRLARWVTARRAGAPTASGSEITPLVRAGVFVAAVYGSYFGAGLGVLLLAVLGILISDSLQRLNGLKSVLSFVVNIVGVLIFLFSGQVVWAFAGVLLVSSYLGGLLGARVARLLSATVLRASVVLLGVVVAIILIIKG